MRRSLDFLYDAAAWLAALAMIGVLAMVLASVLGRLLHFNLPGTDAYAGYCMAAAGFLALAHTLKKNEHIRVSLLIGRLTGGARRGLEIWALTAAVFWPGCSPGSRSGWPGSRTPTTTCPPPTTPRRCGFRSSPWPWAPWCCSSPSSTNGCWSCAACARTRPTARRRCTMSDFAITTLLIVSLFALLAAACGSA
jgi:hypothetical protein